MAAAARIPLSMVENGTILVQGSYAPAVGATAFVYLHGTTTQVTIYTSETAGTTLTQPLTADGNGQLPGWVALTQSGAAPDLDIVPTYHGITGSPALAEPISAGEIVGTDGKIGGPGSIGVTSSVVTNASLPAGFAFYDVIGNSIPGGGGVTNGVWNGYVDKLMFLLGSPRRKRDLSIGGAVSCLPSNQNQTGDGGFGHVLSYLPTPPRRSASADRSSRRPISRTATSP